MYTLILIVAFIILLVVYVLTSIKKIEIISSNKFRKSFEQLVIVVGLVSLIFAAYYFSVNYLTKNSKDLLIYGDGVSFSLVSPANWIVDTTQKERGIQAAF